jgi:hypothetical protein
MIKKADKIKKWNADVCTEEDGITDAFGDIIFLDRYQTSKVILF